MSVLLRGSDYATEKMISDKDATILLVFFISLVILLVSVSLYINFIKPVIQERSYIKYELYNSRNKDERRYWKRELRRFYLKHIPLIGFFFSKKK